MPRLARLLPCLVALVAAGATAQPVWDLLESSPFDSYRSEDIHFESADLGWAVDGSGRVSRTTDSGQTWAQTAQLGGYLRSVTFASPQVGWVGVLFDSAKLYETRDGGLTFQNVTGRIQPAVTSGICSLFAVDEQVVYGAGQYASPATVIKTADGGQTWTSYPLAPLLDTIIDIYFFDRERGLAVGGVGAFPSTIAPRIIATEDGGASWTAVHTVTDVPRGWGWKISFPTPEVGYVSIEKDDQSSTARLLKTVDGGATWSDVFIPDAGNGNLQGVGFVTPDIGWASGRGTTSMTLDGGATWTRQPAASELDGQVNRFRFLEGGLGFAAGRSIFRLPASGVATDGDPSGALALRVSPTPTTGPLAVTIDLPQPSAVVVEVFDALGRRVWSAPATGSGETRIEVDASAWAPGLYVVRATAGGETVATTVVRR